MSHESTTAARNLGPSSAARKIAPVSNTTLRAWLDRGWISGVRVGRNILYDLDSIAAMMEPVGALADSERVAIAESVATSPDPTPEQVAELRSIIHSTSEVADE